ncbi:MAG: hypothetical protein HZB51_08670 [Chloroflexi bacterium]|nr:hypothetical protein [Chloroflexota bacterium]
MRSWATGPPIRTMRAGAAHCAIPVDEFGVLHLLANKSLQTAHGVWVGPAKRRHDWLDRLAFEVGQRTASSVNDRSPVAFGWIAYELKFLKIPSARNLTE